MKVGRFMTKYKTYNCYFETTVYNTKKKTEFLSANIVQLYTQDVTILGSIADFINFFETVDEDCVLYFDYLSLDGSYILDYLKRSKKFNESSYITEHKSLKNDKVEEITKLKKPYTYTYLMYGTGELCAIIIKLKNKVVEIRDNIKVSKFNLKQKNCTFDTNLNQSEKMYIEKDILLLNRLYALYGGFEL